MELGRKRCTMFIIKSRKKQIMKKLKKKIRILREKENYKYLGTLETHLIKQVKMKDFFKSISRTKA